MTGIGLGWMGIPIDHVLHRGFSSPVNMRLGPDIGSDHLPVVVDLPTR